MNVHLGVEDELYELVALRMPVLPQKLRASSFTALLKSGKMSGKVFTLLS